MNTEKKVACFDMDGTLVQTHLYSPVCNREALAYFGITDVTDEQIISSIGHPFRDFISVLKPDFSADDIKKYYELLVEADHKYMPDRCRLFDGVRESLNKLRKEGWVTVICSNSAPEYYKIVDDITHLSDLLDGVYTLENRKDKSDTLRYILGLYPGCKAVMVGDAIFDKIAADDCGVPFVGCLYGYGADEIRGNSFTVDTGWEIYDAVTAAIR